MSKNLLAKKVKGSFTVEASFIVPFITFIIIAFLYMTFFVHDRALLKTYSYRAGQNYLEEEFASKYNRNKSSASGKITATKKALKKSLIMMKVDDMTISQNSLSFKNIYHAAKSYKAVTIQASGHMNIKISGAALFTGNKAEASKDITLSKTDYADDWFKKHFTENLNSN